MPKIALFKLCADPLNPNVCQPEVLTKIKRNIERTGLCPPLIVRPHPKKKDHYILIDGHHRKKILEELDWKSVECQVWQISEPEAKIALATLNRLHGEDQPRKRAELIELLTQLFPKPDLAELIPESAAEIEDLLGLLRFDFDTLEKDLQQRTDQEHKTLPVPFNFMIPANEASTVEKALARFAEKDRGASLVALCQYVLGEDHVQG